ncbi:cytochrome P450 [Actinoplanes sp. NPDC000266]
MRNEPSDHPGTGRGYRDDRIPTVSINAAFKADSPRLLAALLVQGPIHRVELANGLHAWMVLTYQQAREALTMSALSKDPSPAQDALAALGYTAHLRGAGFGGSMLESDPPAHARLREPVASAFSPRRSRELASRIQVITDDLLDTMAAHSEIDLVEAFCGPLPVAVICELLGVPEHGRANFRSWTSAAFGTPSARQRAGMLNINRHLAALLEHKREQPADDLLSTLAASGRSPDGLSDSEQLATAMLLVTAGHDTTVNLISNMMLGLLRHPEQADLLRARPDLMPGAVEELLRHDPPVEYTTYRYAAKDLLLAGRWIRRGDIVIVMLGSAGRDTPQHEGGRADALDVSRREPRHLAFGHGIHHCLGAPLARLEARIAVGSLLRRFPELRLAVPLDQLAWIGSGRMRGPLRLPVRLAP